jgi:hypothetical protein
MKLRLNLIRLLTQQSNLASNECKENILQGAWSFVGTFWSLRSRSWAPRSRSFPSSHLVRLIEPKSAKESQGRPKIIAYKPEVLINFQLIYNYLEQLLPMQVIWSSSMPFSTVFSILLQFLSKKAFLL